jgi:3-carboxy-cis,cis-muconate cycloisomerase
MLAGTLGKLAVDVQVLTRTEIGEVAEATAAGRGASSAMPQKHNPVFATMIATAARLLPAQVGVLYQSMVAEDERSAGAWHAEWQALRETLRLGAGAARNAVALTEGLTVSPDRMLANLVLTDGAVVSERITAVLAPLMGRTPAKSLLTRASNEASATGGSLADVLVEVAADEGHDINRALVADLVRPQGYLGAAGDLVDRVLRRYHERAGR